MNEEIAFQFYKKYELKIVQCNQIYKFTNFASVFFRRLLESEAEIDVYKE